ncbi:hypothetical protein L3Q82_004261 [Scortum barcoo]|uniref:Uncharacterized protein n=1 Tax=Scortum barcoo TaxID=214431 RepID=A0ACB8VJH2_9TELE|nr:hypothetical protein L3Q82_004261 [Scortum barcoo]
MLGNAGSYANKKRKKPVLKQCLRCLGVYVQTDRRTDEVAAAQVEEQRSHRSGSGRRSERMCVSVITADRDSERQRKKSSDGNDVVKSNPSKRHRDRLNGELDRLTDLLPFHEEVRSRLDKLSVLRLSVGYLRVKSYFKGEVKQAAESVAASPDITSEKCQSSMKNNNNNGSLMFPGANGQNGTNTDIGGFSEGDLLLQALNGFVMVVTSEGTVFYTSPTIKDYLGFHQSDVVHQSVFDLIHTDDRTTFRQQLHFALNPPNVGVDGNVLPSCGNPVMYSPEQLPPENSSFLERSFVCRFRCLLDNSSGFLALKFQGRLKYLHGQTDGTSNKSQLALFAIAMPVQPPTIVEIRAKMLLFQSKHKLDFTPMGIDSRGKVVLGYSETELCMKGSGYQFIHAADMMYCADNHIRMIKTGESGLTVFRLLSKSGGWVWVKANAKLIYKGGRPEFIIAYQKALVNAEGEEYLRQRRLQLPFSFTTGEAVLYNTGLTVDVTEFQFNKMFSNNHTNNDVTPGSLLDCFLKQDETAYSQMVDTPLPVDQVFMDSRALVSVASDAWQESGTVATTSDPVVVKEEAKQSVMAVIDDLEKMAENGDFCKAALQNLEVPDAELMEWENTLKRLSQDENQQNNVRSDLDSILTQDIFDYIDSVLFKEKGEDCLNSSPPSCLNNNQPDPFGQEAPGLCEPQLFQAPSPSRTINGFYAHLQETVNKPVITDSAQIFGSTQKLSHHGPLITQADTALPPLQQLQLQDIFSPSIELPELTVPDVQPPSASFQSCGQASISPAGRPQGVSGQTPSSQLLLRPQNNLQTPAANGQLQSSVQQPNNVAPTVMDILPPLIPCSDFNSSGTPNISIPFATTCVQGTPPLGTHNHQVQQWPQGQQQKGIMQNGHELMPAHQTSGSQTFPRSDLWQRSVTGLNHAQQGGLACGQAATQSSCMFNQHFSSSPAGGDVLALSGSSGLMGADPSMDQSPPQGSCYFQWSHSEPVAGTSAIHQEKVNISPVTAPPCMSSSEHTLNIQHYLERRRHTQKNKRKKEGMGSEDVKKKKHKHHCSCEEEEEEGRKHSCFLRVFLFSAVVGERVKQPPAEGAKSNPSKRHRDRLNGELERLASLLPFPEEVTASLDKLSILRLTAPVSYLRAKNFFSVALNNRNGVNNDGSKTAAVVESKIPEGELFAADIFLEFQALNGFVLVITASGTIFYSSHTIQDYLGFHQTDVMHQSVYELVHTEDQQELRRNLHWALNPPAAASAGTQDSPQEMEPDSSSAVVTYKPEQLPPENSSFLERSFVCRFRCLLDNSSGFLALNIQGRLKFLHGQNQRQENGGKAPPQLALFAIATPLQPPSILEIRTKNMIFRTKHKLDFTPMACDAKGKIVLGYTEAELRVRGSGYQFIHAADMLYCAENHVRMMKTGESGLTVFRLLTKENRWKWVQANARLVYKNGKPDYIIATQRPLLDEEGGEHLRKRSIHLPFTYATGEALLYQSNHPIAGFRDGSHEKNGSKSKKSRTDRLARDGVDPGSLLGALMSQDESVYVCQPAVEPKMSFHSSFFDQMNFSDSEPSGLHRSWDEPSNGVLGPGVTELGISFDPLLATLDSLSLEGQGVVDSEEGGCSNGDLFGALEGLGLSAEDLELLLLDERMIRVEMDPEHVPTLDDLLTNDEILSYIYDSLEGKSGSTEQGGQVPSSTSSATATTVSLPESNPTSDANVQMQYPHHKSPLVGQAPIVQLSQQMHQHLNMRAAQDILVSAGIELGHYNAQQTVFNGKASELDGEHHQQQTHEHYLQQQQQSRMQNHLSQQCHAKQKAANLNGLCGISNTERSAGKSEWQDYGFSESLGSDSCLDNSQKPLTNTSLDSCIDYSMPDIDNADYTISGGGLFGRNGQQHGAESTVSSFQGMNHKRQQEQIPVPLAQVISSLSQCPPPNASLDQILGVSKPCRQLDHYGMVNSEIDHDPSKRQRGEEEEEEEAGGGGGGAGGDRGRREAERPWRTAAEREVGPGTIERSEASPETPNKPREGRQKERKKEGERQKERKEGARRGGGDGGRAPQTENM